MSKQRGALGRSRTTPRDERRVPPVVDAEAARIAAARRVAARFVNDHWPELAGVVPTVTFRHLNPPSPELLQRAGVDPAELRAYGGAVYTFTFAGMRAAPEGAPLVAAVTVDGQHRIVKASVTR
jgi:hypothetical protein